jgi:hypothetical protein
MKTRWKGFLALTVMLIVLSVAWITIIGALGYFEEDRVEISRSFQLTEGANLTVRNIEGKTEIDVWEGDTLELKFIKKTYFGKDELDKVELLVDQDHDLHLEAESEKTYDWIRTDFEIRVPSFVNVIEVISDSGKIVLDGISGNVTAKTESGEIRINNVEVVEKARSKNGAVDIRDCGLVKEASTDNGGINLERCDWVIFASVENGGIMGEDIQVFEEAEAENGGIDIEVMSIAAEGMLINAENGGIYLKIPENMTADFDMRVKNGAVDLQDFSVRTYLVDRDDEKKGSVNGGGPLIKMRADNGGIILKGV